jgi:hypothetical protein
MGPSDRPRRRRMPEIKKCYLVQFVLVADSVKEAMEKAEIILNIDDRLVDFNVFSIPLPVHSEREEATKAE